MSLQNHFSAMSCSDHPRVVARLSHVRILVRTVRASIDVSPLLPRAVRMVKSCPPKGAKNERLAPLPFSMWILTKGAINPPAVRSPDPVQRASKRRFFTSPNCPELRIENRTQYFVRCYWSRSLAREKKPVVANCQLARHVATTPAKFRSGGRSSRGWPPLQPAHCYHLSPSVHAVLITRPPSLAYAFLHIPGCRLSDP